MFREQEGRWIVACADVMNLPMPAPCIFDAVVYSEELGACFDNRSVVVELLHDLKRGEELVFTVH